MIDIEQFLPITVDSEDSQTINQMIRADAKRKGVPARVVPASLLYNVKGHMAQRVTYNIMRRIFKV